MDHPQTALSGQKLLGFMLAHEQFTVPQLTDLGAAAARAGFGLLATSDHFQPWQANEGHCGEAWVTLGALGGRAEPAWIGTTVTCPILRYHPAVVAEAFASLAQLYPGRVFLGVGSGEALNEQAATGDLAILGRAMGTADRSHRDYSSSMVGGAREPSRQILFDRG